MKGLFTTAQNLAPEEERRRTAKRRLVDEARRLVEEVALLDAGSVADGEIDGLTRRVGEVADAVAQRASLRDGGLFAAPGFAARLLERSPISGESNPLAAPLRLWFDGDTTRGTAVYGPAYEGPPDIVHGGVVAGAFDELLSMAQAASGSAGFTGTLTVRMRKPTPLAREISYEAGVDRVEGRKIHAWGRSTADGQTLVEGEGVFIASYSS